MKTIKLRVDDWLFDRLKNFDLTIQDSCVRVAKKLNKGLIDLSIQNLPDEGNLDHILTIDLPDDLADIDTEKLRLGLRIVFAQINYKPEPVIHSADIKYKYAIESNIKQFEESLTT